MLQVLSQAYQSVGPFWNAIINGAFCWLKSCSTSVQHQISATSSFACIMFICQWLTKSSCCLSNPNCELKPCQHHKSDQKTISPDRKYWHQTCGICHCHSKNHGGTKNTKSPTKWRRNHRTAIMNKQSHKTQKQTGTRKAPCTLWSCYNTTLWLKLRANRNIIPLYGSRWKQTRSETGIGWL